MKAWCKFQGVPESMADFEFNGRTLSPKDTPAACSFSARDGVMRITAKPKEETVATTASAEVSQHASPPMAEQRQQEQSVQEQNSTQRNEGDEKVSIQVVAHADGGDNVIDFKLKSSSRLDKMMKAWCKCNGIPESDAVFEFNGRELLPEDTPASCSWSSRDGVMRITAKPKEETVATTASAEVSQHASPPMPENRRQESLQEQNSTQPSEDDEKVSIQVVAHADGGDNVTDFKMKSSSRFDKMMKAWCKCNGIPESDAVFEFNGRLLLPEDTPASCSWSSRDGVMRITAKPKEETAATTASAEVSQHASPPMAEQRQQEQSVQEQNSTQRNEGDEKVSIQVVAHADGGDNVIDFKLKSSSRLDKMMKAWCKCNGIPESDAVFEFNGRLLLPEDTPASCSWSSRDGVMRITAKPKEETVATTASAEVSQHASPPMPENRRQESVQEQNSTQPSEDDEKVSIQVVAHADGGDNVTDFKMKSSSRFDKMMKAWCKCNGIPESDAVFEFNGRLLLPEDTPASCSWSSRDGVMRITAKPKEETAATTASAEVSQHASPPMPENRRQESLQEQNSTQPSEDDEKVSIQVVAHADGGDNVIDFKLKSSSRLDKMMKAWCKCNGIPESDAVFEFNGRELLPEDTPASCSWSSRDGVMRITAKPKEETVATTASAEVSQHASPPMRENRRQESVQEQNSTQPSEDDEKVSIQVVAHADGGDNVTDLKMKSSSRFDKMMKAWCKNHSIPESQAVFEFNGRELLPEDTPASCSWSSRDGVMRITAKPKEETAATTASAEVSQHASPPMADNRRQEQSVRDKTLSLQTKDDEKVSIQVVARAAGGENLVDFKMKPTSKFDKLMKTWCKSNCIPESDAFFEFNGRLLLPEDTPASCSWSSRNGVMRITAKPKEETAATTASAEVSQHASPPMPENRQQEQSVQEQNSTQPSDDNEKVSIQVVAHAEGGDNVTDFKMKSSSSFDKMMKAWCKNHSIPESAAVFEFNGRLLLPEDTPTSCSWSSHDGVMRITAKPKEETAATTASAEVSQHASPPMPENRQQEQSVQEQNSTQPSDDNEKVSIQVVAHAEGGDNVTDFKMKSSSSFDKMMKAWCKNHSIPESAAVFEFNGRLLLPEDTPASCSWSSRDGAMRITAKPKEETAATTASPSAKDPAGPADYADAASSKDEPVQVQACGADSYR